MLALLGFTTVFALFVAIITNRMSPLVALIAIPTIAALLGGFGLDTGRFMIEGIKGIAPIAAMFIFAILYFGIMSDAGMMDPIIDRILAVVGNDPRRITMGSALLALLVRLDGSGAVAFLVTVPAMLPVYERLGMQKRILACVVSLAVGVTFLPWTGPVMRAAGALKVPVAQIFNPLLGVLLVGIAYTFVVAWWLGRREALRLGLSDVAACQRMDIVGRTLSEAENALRRPDRFWVNVSTTIVVMIVMIAGWMDPVVVFMIGTVIALLVNYPKLDVQKNRVDAHAKAALMMASVQLAAGAFTGIMAGTHMLNAVARTAVDAVPASAAPHIPLGLGLISMPLSLLFDPDSFYYGVLPIIAEVYRNLGGDPVHVAQAAILGQMTTGFPVSPLTPATFLIVGMCGIGLGEHQRFSIPFLFGASVVMTIAAVLFGVFPL